MITGDFKNQLAVERLFWAVIILFRTIETTGNCWAIIDPDHPGPLYSVITKRLKFYAETPQAHRNLHVHFAGKVTSTSSEIREVQI